MSLPTVPMLKVPRPLLTNSTRPLLLVVFTRRLRCRPCSVDEWGKSDHCRLLIEVKS